MSILRLINYVISILTGIFLIYAYVEITRSNNIYVDTWSGLAILMGIVPMFIIQALIIAGISLAKRSWAIAFFLLATPLVLVPMPGPLVLWGINTFLIMAYTPLSIESDKKDSKQDIS